MDVARGQVLVLLVLVMLVNFEKEVVDFGLLLLSELVAVLVAVALIVKVVDRLDVMEEDEEVVLVVPGPKLEDVLETVAVVVLVTVLVSVVVDPVPVVEVDVVGVRVVEEDVSDVVAELVAVTEVTDVAVEVVRVEVIEVSVELAAVADVVVADVCVAVV